MKKLIFLLFFIPLIGFCQSYNNVNVYDENGNFYGTYLIDSNYQENYLNNSTEIAVDKLINYLRITRSNEEFEAEKRRLKARADEFAKRGAKVGITKSAYGLGDDYFESRVLKAEAKQTELNRQSNNYSSLSSASRNVIVPLKVNFNDYTDIALVGFEYPNQYKYFKKRLIRSSLNIINPKEYDKKRFKENNWFLKKIKNKSWLYLYWDESINNSDRIYTLILKNYKNETVYHVVHTNSFDDIFLPIISY